MPRFDYSRWDGTQVGFEFDADDVLGEITDDLLYHGDLNQALRRMLQQGFRDQQGERVAGHPRAARAVSGAGARTSSSATTSAASTTTSPSGSARSSTWSGPASTSSRRRPASRAIERRQEITDEVAAERRMQLDLLPPDLAGQVRDLQEYEWTSSEARERFDELLDQLRQELMQSYFNQMSGAMSDVSPEQLQRMKDMFNGLNELLEMRERGEDTTAAFEQFMERFGDFFPGNPETLDELLEQMAQQMAAMQNLLNSMTPEQRAQLQGLAEELLEDMDLRWQVDRLGANLRQAFPGAGWDRRPAQLRAARTRSASPRRPGS